MSYEILSLRSRRDGMRRSHHTASAKSLANLHTGR
jgi:hypothetical protein